MVINKLMAGALAALVTLSFGACGDDDTDDNNNPIDARPIDARPIDAADGTVDAPPNVTTWKQVEHLARPGIAEALLLTNAYLEGYNATAPTYAGVPAPVLDLVIAEAKTVLKAVYYGVCLINGAAGLTADTGLKPAGLTCADVGGGIFSDVGATTIKPAVATAAQAYADQVFGQFVPDVMRIDTSVNSAYLTLCAGPGDSPLLCGGRQLNEDVIDITYNYLFAGAAITPASPAQFQALVSDGVHFQATGPSPGGLTTPVASNPGQFHPPVSTTFPYSAAPL